MGNSNVHHILPLTNSSNEFDLPPFIVDRIISDKIKIGVDKDCCGIKYKNDNMYYYSKLINSKKEKNYIEFMFQDNSSLIIFSKDETCSEKEKLEDDLKFMFDSTTLKTNGTVCPKYKTMGLLYTPFDEIVKLQ